MADAGLAALPVVDGLTLPDDVRALLRPGEAMRDRTGAAHALPRWFFQVDSWETARATPLAPHFTLWEFMTIDVREAERFRHGFPRYVPCAVAITAAALEVFRAAVGTYVHIAANGGYRSPAHRLSRHASRHCWASAVNIYRIGDDWLDGREAIERYGTIAREALPAAWIRPYGPGDGCADDHLHVDLGYLDVRPAGHETPCTDGGATA